MRKPDQLGCNKDKMNNHKGSSIKSKLRKGLWSPEEDEKLIRYMLTRGQGCWSDIARNAGLQRCGKSCRLRWINYLRPDLKRGAFSPQEEDLIIHLHSILGNRYPPPSLSLSPTLLIFFFPPFIMMLIKYKLCTNERTYIYIYIWRNIIAMKCLKSNVL